MLVLSVKRQKHCSKMASERLRTTTPKVHGDKARHVISALVSEKIDSLPQTRKEKVLAIRQKLNSGKYGINEKLNVASDRLIENLITKRMEEDEIKSKTRRQ